MQFPALLAVLSTLASPLAPAHGAPPHDARRARVLAAARRHLAKPFAGDCTDFVRRVYAEARVPLPAESKGRSATESMFRSLSRVRRPRPGDLAFFHRTYDRDGPGPRRNRFTHVALVESVHGSQLTLIHRGGAGIRRIRMNLARPADRRENDVLRRRGKNEALRARALAGELFAGFGSALRPEVRARRTVRQ